MTDRITLRAFTADDVAEHNAGEDAEMVRWLTGGQPSTVESTTQWIAGHVAALRDQRGEQVFAVELDGRLAGMVSANLDHVRLGLDPGEINISYAVHPWARRRGVARRAVGQLCRWLADRQLGTTAVIRVDPGTEASVRTALSCGFVPTGTRAAPDGEVHDHFTRSL